ncbi:MAG: response regulator transcription factor [Actinobacteria bacterium]|nr:response regulator transcription factor [Actinomycetota bacterium]
MPLLLVIDLAFCALILHLTGGWASPFYLYCFSPLLTSALLFQFKGALYSASSFSFLYAFTLSESTVKTHVSSVLKKLNLKSRAEAAAYLLKDNNSKK